MKKTCFILFLLTSTLIASAQKKLTDSLYKNLAKANTDTARFNALVGLCNYYYIAYPDSAIIFGQKAYETAEKNNWQLAEARSYNGIANAYGEMGDYVKSIQYYLKALKFNEKVRSVYGIATVDNNIGATYIQSGDYAKADPYLKEAARQMDILKKTKKLERKEIRLSNIILENIGENFLDLHQ